MGANDKNGNRQGQQTKDIKAVGSDEVINPDRDSAVIGSDMAGIIGEGLSPDRDSASAIPVTGENIEQGNVTGEVTEAKNPSTDSGAATNGPFTPEQTAAEYKLEFPISNFASHAALILSSARSDATVNEFVCNVIGIYIPGDNEDDDNVFAELVDYFSNGIGIVSYSMETKMMVDCMKKVLDGNPIDGYAGHIPEALFKKLKDI